MSGSSRLSDCQLRDGRLYDHRLHRRLRDYRSHGSSKTRRRGEHSDSNGHKLYVALNGDACHDPDASGHGTCTTTVCYHIVSLSTVPLVPPSVLLPHSGLIYDNTPFDLFQLCLDVSRLVVSAL